LTVVTLLLVSYAIHEPIQVSAQYAGHPPRLATPDRWASEERKRAVHIANGHVWPQKTKFFGWPPKENGVFSDAYLKTRKQLEAHFRQIPVSVHHRVDDFEELAQSMVLPRFTPHGFKVVDGPKELWQQLRKNYNANKRYAPLERFPRSNEHVSEDHNPGVIGNREQQRLNAAVTEALKPICEEWAGVELIPTSTYGVRVYHNGSTLFMHLDVASTHVISAIFHIDHDLDEQWPLEIEDHEGRIHAVTLEPGQIVLYESATQFHSRVTPMRGRDYGSVFVHYKPVGWNWTETDIIAAVTPDSMRENFAGENMEEDPGLPPIETYRRDYYKKRGLGLLEFVGPDLLALPVQNAAMMTESIPHSEL